jgi:hypothetical protein
MCKAILLPMRPVPALRRPTHEPHILARMLEDGTEFLAADQQNTKEKGRQQNCRCRPFLINRPSDGKATQLPSLAPATVKAATAVESTVATVKATAAMESAAVKAMADRST